ncbi:hypothetical protein [Halorussus halophilus]|uniref:hypothetical protein n=1 Tax=Halorussus halophilus TaxID=2650975 RepID=UPI00130189D7|nr:hypothetical protein [Halorussus halophilus]
MTDVANVVPSPLRSPVFQGVSGFVLTLACATLAEQATMPTFAVHGVLAVGVVLFVAGLWRMLPRGVEEPVAEW